MSGRKRLRTVPNMKILTMRSSAGSCVIINILVGLPQAQQKTYLHAGDAGDTGRGRSLGWEEPLRKKWQLTYSILA